MTAASYGVASFSKACFQDDSISQGYVNQAGRVKGTSFNYQSIVFQVIFTTLANTYLGRFKINAIDNTLNSAGI